MRRGFNDRAELAASFLEYACADPILANGPASHVSRASTALRLLKRHPDVARYSIHTAVVCGDLEEVQRILAERPAAASEPGGPIRRRSIQARESLWPPLLHLCYGRLPVVAARESAVDIARALLDAGADPNAYFEVGTHPNRYTALCGVAGEGEDDAPPHCRREELARLLLERGAEPYDGQVLYNTHFHGDILWLLELIHSCSVRAGRQADWDDPNWSMLSQGGYGCGARYLLSIAVRRNDARLAEWLLAHGANPNAPPPPHPKAPKRTLHEEALARGFTEMADLLERKGASPGVLDGPGAFAAACLRLDRAEATALLRLHPELLLAPGPMTVAAEGDRADVVALLLELGMSPDIRDPDKGGQRPLHVAAHSDSTLVAAVLIEHGAEVDATESNWGNTPLGSAVYAQALRTIELLGRVSRDVWALTYSGHLERLRELLSGERGLARLVRDGETPLMWLPDDEGLAIQIVELFLTHGADPTIRNKAGLTAADLARQRQLDDAAELLRSRPV